MFNPWPLSIGFRHARSDRFQVLTHSPRQIINASGPVWARHHRCEDVLATKRHLAPCKGDRMPPSVVIELAKPRRANWLLVPSIHLTSGGFFGLTIPRATTSPHDRAGLWEGEALAGHRQLGRRLAPRC